MWSSDSSDDDEVVVVRRQRVYKVRVDYGVMRNSYEFNERFRLSSEKMEVLLNYLGPVLGRDTNRSQALSPALQVQTALHWLGTGAQYHAVSDMSGVSKASVCRAIHDVVEAVNLHVYPENVQWPANMEEVVQRFFDLAGFPMVCGVIDGTLVNILAPTEHEETFVDRHGKHSINCMVVCGPGHEFFYSYANWPGSTHDARVLRNSLLFERMEEGWRPFADGVLLGDSAYPLKNWLMPPILRDPDGRGNQRFLRAHKSTRRIVENSLGILKQKFPYLRYLRVDPEFACQIFNCCVALCNFSRNQDEEIYEHVNNDEEINDEENNDVDYYEPDDHQGVDRLQEIIDYFE